jgi:hypothetical protein
MATRSEKITSLSSKLESMLGDFEDIEALAKEININASALSSFSDKIKTYRESLQKQLETERTKDNDLKNKTTSV